MKGIVPPVFEELTEKEKVACVFCKMCCYQMLWEINASLAKVRVNMYRSNLSTLEALCIKIQNVL